MAAPVLTQSQVKDSTVMSLREADLAIKRRQEENLVNKVMREIVADEVNVKTELKAPPP